MNLLLCLIVLCAGTVTSHANNDTDAFGGRGRLNIEVRDTISVELSRLTTILEHRMNIKLNTLSHEIRQELRDIRNRLEADGIGVRIGDNQDEDKPSASSPFSSSRHTSEHLTQANIELRRHEDKMNQLNKRFQYSINKISNAVSSFTEIQKELVEGDLRDFSQETTEMLENIYNFALNQVNELTTISRYARSRMMEKIRAKNCKELLLQGKNESGVYTINIENMNPKNVYCDQETGGGGWTVFLSRQKDVEMHEDFNRNMAQYVQGFGDAGAEHWIGLDTLHALTKENPYELLVQMRSKEHNAFSRYGSFSVGGPFGGNGDKESYRLNVGEYDTSSTGGDGMTPHHGKPFSTVDVDHDDIPDMSCSSWTGGGGWWFANCFNSNPTGLYPTPDLNLEEFLGDVVFEWRSWEMKRDHIDDLIFKIRPR